MLIWQASTVLSFSLFLPKTCKTIVFFDIPSIYLKPSGMHFPCELPPQLPE